MRSQSCFFCNAGTPAETQLLVVRILATPVNKDLLATCHVEENLNAKLRVQFSMTERVTRNTEGKKRIQLRSEFFLKRRMNSNQRPRRRRTDNT